MEILWGYCNIKYLIILDLMMTWYRIYKKKDEISFMKMKSIQLVFNVLELCETINVSHLVL
jgi:hypothetical protein